MSRRWDQNVGTVMTSDWSVCRYASMHAGYVKIPDMFVCIFQRGLDV